NKSDGIANRKTAILLVFTLAVMVGFWTLSRYPALGQKAVSAGVAELEDTLTHEAHFSVPSRASFSTKVIYSSLNWYYSNWQGMAFGLVLAASFLVLLTYLPRSSSQHRFRNSFYGMLAGTPLGVCVNCVAPIAKSVYEASRCMEMALAMMFSSPSLNIVVLTMLFTLFPFYMAALKVGTTFLLVLVIVPFLSKRNPQFAAKNVGEASTLTDSFCEMPVKETWGTAFVGVVRDYWKSLIYIVIRTVPLMILAGFLGALLSHLISFEAFMGREVSLLNLAVISIVGTFLPLPIGFDIMLAQALKMSGLSAGYVVTLLFTLGTFSIYSCMILSRTFSLRIAVQLYLIVCMLGIGLGYAGNLWSSYKYEKWLKNYDAKVIGLQGARLKQGKISAKQTEASGEVEQKPSIPFKKIIQKKTLFYSEGDLQVAFRPHQSRNESNGLPFTRMLGSEMGIHYLNKLTPLLFFEPIYHGRGITSGDMDGDGWVDLAIATDKGYELYRNQGGKQFQKLPLADPWPEKKMQGIAPALVDMDNDGRLDFFLTTWRNGNFLILDPMGTEKKASPIPVPNGNALLTNGLGFADINRNGFLDIVNGNYFLGEVFSHPFEETRNQVVYNKGLHFELMDLPGPPGQTHSVLLTDFNDDTFLDLIVANDFSIPDSYYLGTREGIFERILKERNIVPKTPFFTMSVDSADYNNDLIQDIFLANIGFEKNLNNIINIFGKEEREIGSKFCNSGKTVLGKEECNTLTRLLTVLSLFEPPEDQTDTCEQFKNPQIEKECLITQMTLAALKKNDPALCDKIPPSYELSLNKCRDYFIPKLGHLDFQNELEQQDYYNILLQGTEKGKFIDVSEITGIKFGEWAWNAKFADLDNDEWQDVFLVNGSFLTQEFTTNKFFRNLKGKAFSASQKEFGLEDYDQASAFNLIDFDNDGDLDIITNTNYGPFIFYINNESEKNSLTLKLRDGQGNRFCIGCKVVIRYGSEEKRHQMRELKASGGYRSFDAPIIHFGLGANENVDEIEIRWSNGSKSTIPGPFPSNREYTISRNEHL
ncbi:MAG: VCBS repeat-containing protein, partial [Nitrospinae bacterium]|nr:VCBS repeat-containing protein [Nitrospinota bacterium]